MAQTGLTMDQKKGPGTPGRTPTPVAGTPAPSPASSIQRRPSIKSMTPARPPSSKAPPPQPINAPIRPASSSTRAPRATASVTKSSIRQWYCSRCNNIVSPEAVSSGEASLQGGQVVCPRCIRKAAEKARSKSLGRLALVAVGLGMAAVGIFAPAQFLFVAALCSACMAMVGVLGFTLSGNVRVVLTGVGVVFAAASFIALRSMNSSAEIDKATQVLRQDAQEVKQLVSSDQLADAQKRLDAMNVRAREADGRFSSPAAEAVVTEARQSIETYIQNRYGQLDERERDVLKNLGSIYPDRAGVQRFREIKVDGTTLRMTVLLNEELRDNQIFDGLRELPFTIFQLFPVLQRVELKFLSPSTQAEAGVCVMARSEAKTIVTRMTATSGLSMKAATPEPPQSEHPAPGQ
jgi:hypothetical protein